MKRLNNLVVELASHAKLESGDVVKFRTPREGWVFISCEGKKPETRQLRINGRPHPWKSSLAGNLEAMCYLPQGEHVLAVHGKPARRLAIRSIPELLFTKYGYNPFVKDYGPYDWQFLKRYVLPHVNTVIGTGSPEQEAQNREWRSAGGKWIVERGISFDKSARPDAGEVVSAWGGEPGMADPAFDGLLLDEFFSGDDARYPAFAEALRRLGADPKFKGKKLYPYCGSHYPDRNDWGNYNAEDTSNSSVPFWRAAIQSGSRIAWERYLQERHDKEIAKDLIEERIGEKIRLWQKVFPSVQESMIIAFGYMSMGFALNAHPSVDYKVFLDMQFHYLATEPALRGLYGITGWTSGYAEEETLKWTAQLYRHYGIEGNTDLLSKRYGFTYELPHIKNPDFAFNWEGWDVPVNIERNCTVKSIDGYSALQGRWSVTDVGNSVMVVKRSSVRPNAISQPIRHLVPGRLYSVKLISGDYDDFVNGKSEEKLHMLKIGIEGGELVKEKCFQSPLPNHPTTKLEPFGRDHRYWFNLHHLVFRATAKTGKITISDWATPREPGAPVGQSTMYNFVELQPYWTGDEQ